LFAQAWSASRRRRKREIVAIFAQSRWARNRELNFLGRFISTDQVERHCYAGHLGISESWLPARDNSAPFRPGIKSEDEGRLPYPRRLWRSLPRFGRPRALPVGGRRLYAPSPPLALSWKPSTTAWASQASDVGSIPIARSINSDDSVDLTRLKHWKTALKWPVLVGSWREVRSIGGNSDLAAWSRRFDSGDRIATVVLSHLASRWPHDGGVTLPMSDLNWRPSGYEFKSAIDRNHLSLAESVALFPLSRQFVNQKHGFCAQVAPKFS